MEMDSGMMADTAQMDEMGGMEAEPTIVPFWEGTDLPSIWGFKKWSADTVAFLARGSGDGGAIINEFVHIDKDGNDGADLSWLDGYTADVQHFEFLLVSDSYDRVLLFNRLAAGGSFFVVANPDGTNVAEVPADGDPDVAAFDWSLNLAR